MVPNMTLTSCLPKSTINMRYRGPHFIGDKDITDKIPKQITILDDPMTSVFLTNNLSMAALNVI